MTIKVIFYAVCRDLAGIESATIGLPDNCTRENFWAILLERYPDLQNISTRVALAVNNKYSKQDFNIKDSDVISLIPPVSGG